MGLAKPRRQKGRPSKVKAATEQSVVLPTISKPTDANLALASTPIQDDAPGKIDKSVLTISEPRRLRDKAHLKFVGAQPCLICARSPADAHHLKFTQPRAMGRKVSDEFTVPQCRTHHRDIHNFGDEVAWWERRAIDPVAPVYGSVEEVLRRQAGEFDLVYLHRVSNASKYGELVASYFPKARRIYSVADLYHVR